MGMNLEVPIELIDGPGLYSIDSGGTKIFRRCQTILNPADYDGATYYFEILGFNGHASTDYDVTLYNYTTSQTITTITVPHSDSDPVRLRSSAFTPTVGSNAYTVSIPATAANSNLHVYAARIVVVQVNATKTRIQIPLINSKYDAEGYGDATDTSYLDQTTSLTYMQTGVDAYRTYLKDSTAFADLSGDTPWTFEAILGRYFGSESSYCTLWNTTDNLQVTASELLTAVGAPEVPTLLSVDFANDATNFSDGDNFEVKIKKGEGYGQCSIFGARLYVKLENLQTAEVHWRICKETPAIALATNVPHQRALIASGNYDSPQVYFEANGYCADNANRLNLIDGGVADSGVASPTTITSINWNSATKAIQRVGPFAWTSGNRAYVALTNATADHVVTSAFVIIEGMASVSPTVDAVTAELSLAAVSPTVSPTQNPTVTAPTATLALAAIAPTVEPTIGLGTISGTVTDGGTDDPIEDAVVTIEEQPGVTDTTDSSGDYTLPAVVPGTVTVEVTAPGYDDAILPGVVVVAGEDTPNVDIEMDQTVPPTAPAAPTNLDAVPASSTMIYLTWTDNATNEVSFTVERAPAMGGPYVEIATLPANTTSYMDTGLTPSTTYYYHVYASNLAGDSAFDSDWATTPGVPGAVIEDELDLEDEPKEDG
jgi:hypothetical protein